MLLEVVAQQCFEKDFLENALGAEYTEPMTQSIKWLQDEIADRMLQKLDIVKLDVKNVLLIPEFSGKYFSAFTKRFPGATIFGLVDTNSVALDPFGFKLGQIWRRVFRGDKTGPLDCYLKSGKLELADNSVDLIFSDLLLQDLSDPHHFLQECWRVLREGGLLTFSYLGPDTGKELLAIQSGVLELKHLASPWDMHDMGDALLKERFSDPVMDMEFLHLDYEADAVLLADIDALKLLKNPPTEILGQNVLPQKLTLEVVYGHAWAIGKHLAKAQDNVAYIDLNQIGRKTRSDSA